MRDPRALAGERDGRAGVRAGAIRPPAGPIAPAGARGRPFALAHRVAPIARPPLRGPPYAGPPPPPPLAHRRW
jgi:hypothetical protein